MRFVLSGNLIRFTAYAKNIEVEGSTLHEGFSNLVGKHPKLKPVLFDDSGVVRKVHQLFLNGEQIGDLRPESQVGRGDEITIITALAGG